MVTDKDCRHICYKITPSQCSQVLRIRYFDASVLVISINQNFSPSPTIGQAQQEISVGANLSKLHCEIGEWVAIAMATARFFSLIAVTWGTLGTC